MFQIQDMFENGKPDNVLKIIINLIYKKSLKLGIVVLVMFNKMLVMVCIIDFYSGYGPGSRNLVFQFVPISNTQC